MGVTSPHNTQRELSACSYEQFSSRASFGQKRQDKLFVRILRENWQTCAYNAQKHKWTMLCIAARG